MKSVGDDYEDQAAHWLGRQGLQLLTRNFRARTGEIDIVAIHDKCLVFVEVRARNNRHFASAAASVDRRKQLRLMRTALIYRQLHPQLALMPCRFDVIAFDPPQSGSDNPVSWIRSAFTA